jgi:hypothetical protein
MTSPHILELLLRGLHRIPHVIFFISEPLILCTGSIHQLIIYVNGLQLADASI